MATKVHLVKAVIFPYMDVYFSHIQMWELDHKEDLVLKNWTVLLNCSAGEDSGESLGLHGDKTLLFSHSVVSDSSPPLGLWHARLLCPSPSPRACSNSCPLSWWCHPNISSSITHFSFCLQSFPASGSFVICQVFALSGQSIGLQLQHQSFQWIFRIDFL